jgi:hypothetical protein
MKFTLLTCLKYLILIGFFFGQAGDCEADDEVIPEITTLTGKVYKNVRITKLLPNEIAIMHETGTTRIPLTALSEELRIKLGCDLGSKIKKIASAYAELGELKLRPEFHKGGFTDQAAKKWLDSLKTLQNDAELNKELLSKGVAFGELEVLAREWQGSKGLDTEYTTSFVPLWNKALGLKSEEAQEKKPENIKIAAKAPMPKVTGIWRMKNRNLLMDKISLLENEKGEVSGFYHFIGGSKLEFTTKEAASKVGRTFKIIESPSGDYIRIKDSGELELADDFGVLNTGTK